MFDLDHWREIWGALTANKLRTALTALGVFWGIFLLMVMLGSGNGLRNGVTQDFAGSATNSFFVWSQATTRPYRGLPAGRRIRLSNDDHRALLEQVSEAEVIAPRNQLGGFGSGDNVTRREKTGAFSVYGDQPEIAEIQSLRITAGRFLNRLDVEQRRKVAVIGQRVREVLFDPEEDPVGDHIEIRGVYFKVVGVFDSIRSGDGARRDVETVFTPFSTFQQAFNYGDRVGWFAITSRPGIPASEVEQKVLRLLEARHRVAPDDGRAFGHWNTEDEFNKIQGLFLGIRALVWIVGIGTLAAGVIGVSNIMLVIVRERTHEIGIRRALGAVPSWIMLQIILEALLLTAMAGYAGLFLGVWGMDRLADWLAGSGAEAEMFRDPGVGLESAGSALVILIVSGVLAGVIPAVRAVRITPVQALRMD